VDLAYHQVRAPKMRMTATLTTGKEVSIGLSHYAFLDL
jgi:hypothetical protein